MRRAMLGGFFAIALAMVSTLVLWSSGSNAVSNTQKSSSNISAMKQTSIARV